MNPWLPKPQQLKRERHYLSKKPEPNQAWSWRQSQRYEGLLSNTSHHLRIVKMQLSSSTHYNFKIEKVRKIPFTVKISRVSFKIRYVDFWPGFNAENFLFTQILRRQIESRVEIVYDHETLVDLQFHSVFCFASRNEKLKLKALSMVDKSADLDYQNRLFRGFRSDNKYPARKRIWYTGENRRPPTHEFDGTISFETTDATAKNLYFPYWMMRLNWGFPGGAYEIMPRIEELMTARSFIPKQLDTCVFSSGIDPLRERIIDACQPLLNVDKFGSRYGNRVSSKKEVSQKYRFQICTENDIYPGYVTEKLTEAWSVGSIPIWVGMQSVPYFNEDAFLNFTGLEFDSIREKLKSLDSDQIADLQTKPILTKEPNLYPLINFISNFTS